MGEFLICKRNVRTRIEVPGAIKMDWDYEIMITQEAYNTGEIKILQDGVLVVTINTDGEIQVHW